MDAQSNTIRTLKSKQEIVNVRLKFLKRAFLLALSRTHVLDKMELDRLTPKFYYMSVGWSTMSIYVEKGDANKQELCS